MLTHGLEAYASMMATDYTDGLALKSMKNVFDYLPRAYEYGAADPEARQKMADASCMAGMAFANAFLASATRWRTSSAHITTCRTA